MMSMLRTRWAAAGAALAVSLGAGGIGLVSATTPSNALTFVAITPCRVADTRPGDNNVGPKSSPLGPGEVHTVSAHGTNGDCAGIPTTATALSLNVTAVGASLPTFLTIWSTGAPQPEASSLNPSPGAPPAPNAVTTELSGAGQFNIYNEQGTVNVLADINGYYVDHNHDDRYYTKAQTDTRIADSLEAISVFTGTKPSFVPDHVFPTTTVITTTKSGRLHVSLATADRLTCSSDVAWHYVVVDDDPIESSASFGSPSGFASLYVGITAASLRAGVHTIGLAGECYAPAASVTSTAFYPTATVNVVVIP